MGDEDDVVRLEKRITRRDRTRSPHSRASSDEGEGIGLMADTSAKRKSAANFSASKLVENLKESNATTITRLRRTASSDGTEAPTRARRPVGRTMSGQAPRTQRRPRTPDNDMLSQSLADNLGNSSNNNTGLDNSHMSTSLTTGRRRIPARTKSYDSSFPRPQRAPRARRKPVVDKEDSTEDLGCEQTRRRLPGRSKSAQDGCTRGARPSRPGRRRPQPENEGDVFISDSDEDNNDNDKSDKNNDRSLDRSCRRRAPQRSRSSHDGPRGAQRTARAARRRGSGDNADASPKRPGGPGFQRSLTGIPPSSSSGHGLMRSNTTAGRTTRSRGGRNTAQELAQVPVASNSEKSPESSEIEHFVDVSDPMTARETLRSITSQHHSNSPVRSRQDRRRLREEKEREVLERRMQAQTEPEEEEVSEKKEEPWMRRLKKNTGDKTSNEPFKFDDALASARDDKKNNFFPVDPTFGVFPAVSDMPLSTVEADTLDYDDGTTPLSMGENKLDFSTIS